MALAAVGSRRAALACLAAAGAAALGVRSALSQGASAPAGDSRLADLGMELNPEQRAAGMSFLERHPTVDTHSHPGRFFLKQLPYQTPSTRALGEPFELQAIADLNAGRVSAALFAAVADMRLLETTPASGLHAARDFQPGEAYADYQRQLAELKALVSKRELAAGLNPSDIDAAAGSVKHVDSTSIVRRNAAFGCAD